MLFLADESCDFSVVRALRRAGFDVLCISESSPRADDSEVIRLSLCDVECAKIFGTIESKLRMIGRPTGEVDILIAATALAHNAILATTNRRHFENIEGLKLEVWRVE